MSKFRQLPDDIDCHLGEKVDPNKPKVAEPPCARERALQRVTDTIFDLHVAFKELALAFDGGAQAIDHLGALFEELEAAADGMAGKPAGPRKMRMVEIPKAISLAPSMVWRAALDIADGSALTTGRPVPGSWVRTPFVDERNSMGAWSACMGPDAIRQMSGIDSGVAKVALGVIDETQTEYKSARSTFEKWVKANVNGWESQTHHNQHNEFMSDDLAPTKSPDSKEE